MSLAFARLTNKKSHNSQREFSVRLKFLERFSQDSRDKISNDSRESRCEISVCETCESRYEICLRDPRETSLSTKFLSARLVRSVSLRNFVARLAFCDSRCEISVCETHEKRVSLLILTRESRENLARILDLKSESRFSREFQKVILVPTLVCSTLSTLKTL